MKNIVQEKSFSLITRPWFNWISNDLLTLLLLLLQAFLWRRDKWQELVYSPGFALMNGTNRLRITRSNMAMDHITKWNVNCSWGSVTVLSRQHPQSDHFLPGMKLKLIEEIFVQHTHESWGRTFLVNPVWAMVWFKAPVVTPSMQLEATCVFIWDDMEAAKGTKLTSDTSRTLWTELA